MDTTEQLAVLTQVLNSWADGIRKHHPAQVAFCFTQDALFQGLDRSHTSGRPGIETYYEKQPLGLTPHFRILRHRQLAEDVLISYIEVDFIRPEGTTVPVHLTIVLERAEGTWLISHYHVSRID